MAGGRALKATEFISRLSPDRKVTKTKTGWIARCKAHDDGRPSLSISEGDNGGTLLHCLAGCPINSVCAAEGITLADLMPESPRANGNGNSSPSRIVATYDYTDESGALLYQSLRYVPKTFKQRKPDRKGGWIWTVKDCRHVLYRLPQVIAAKAQGKTIHSAEGEKDVEALERAGFVATCNVGGAGKWRDEYTETLTGAHVVIIADKDAPGRAHAQKVAVSLSGKARSIKVVELPDVGGRTVKDATDYFSAGATLDEFQAVIASVPEWKAPAPFERPDIPGVTVPDSGGAEIEKQHFKSDIGYADAIVRRHADGIRYCADEKLWLVFSEARGWQRDNTGQISAMTVAYARELYQWALKKANGQDPDVGKKTVANMAALGNRSRITAALSLAECNPAIVVSSEQLDADPFLVGVENGVVNLRDGTFQPHNRNLLITRRLSVTFDANATAPAWEKFLIEVQPDPEMRGFLQRLSGYNITGDTREHVLPFNYGGGANGKGTFFEQTLLRMAGSYGAKLTNSLVYASDRGALPHLELANLCGKRFTLGEENSEAGELNEALLKAITGGDMVKGRFHYGNFVEYFPTYKVVLVGNHKPRIDGTDDGIWRRFLLVNWPVQIPLEQRDAKLKDKIAAEMPGILNWCIQGAQDWYENGLNPPDSCRVATAEFREQSDKLADFISENFIADPGGSCTKADAFTAYQQWVGGQGIKRPMSKRGLGFQLSNRGWQEFRSGHGKTHCWNGFRIKHTPED
jgi:putative DNA primase/helicase